MQHVMTNRRLLRDDTYRVNHISVEHPWEWLAKGWEDIKRAPGYSLTYGSGIVLLSAMITSLMVAGHLTFLVPFLVAGFFLVAPLLAIGLYQMSARLERRESLHAGQAWSVLRQNQAQLGVVTSFLIVLLQAWILLSVFLVLMLFTDLFPTLENFVPVVFLSGDHILLLVSITAVGALFAICAFCISAVSIPMLIDRPVDAVTAMRTSIRAVLSNPGPMLLWAALIVALVGAAMLTFFIGLFIVVPLLGHATWHAYRDLVPRN
jgi:uncharacterized membrane protein